MTVKRIGFAYNPTIDAAVELSARAAGWCQVRGIGEWQAPSGETETLLRELTSTDLLVVLGGDGTFLRAARAVAEIDVPLLGINLGKVGFLSKAEATDFEDVLGLIAAGDYRIDERMALEGRILRGGMGAPHGLGAGSATNVDATPADVATADLTPSDAVTADATTADATTADATTADVATADVATADAGPGDVTPRATTRDARPATATGPPHKPAQGPVTRHFALNDIVIARGSLARVCRLDVEIDDSHLATFIADGLIVASPTGSTGYSFSAGGPIVDPISRNLIVTPIAAYLSAIRSVVASPDQVVRCTVVDAYEALVSIDGREDLPIAVGDVVEVRAVERPIRLVEPAGAQPFWDLLRHKVALLPS